MSPGLEMWVIHERPRDCPEGYVVRRWFVAEGREEHDRLAFYVATLERARAVVPPGLAMLPRFGDDDPAIREVWL